MSTTSAAQTARGAQDASPAMRLRVLAMDSAVYGGAEFVSKAIAFVTFPLIAAALSPLAFGTLELLMTVVALLGIAANCGLNNAVQRFYWDAETPIDRRQELVSSGLAALALLLLLSFALGLAATAVLVRWFPSWNLPMTWIAPIAALLLMVSTQTAQYLLDVIRLHINPWRFFGVSLATRVATALGGVFAVVWLGFGLDGLLAIQATVSLVALPLAVLAVRRDLSTAIDLDVCRKLLRFGHPFVYSSIAFWLFGSIDRWLLAALSSIEEVGIYSVAYRFASIVMMVSFAFGQAWAPLALKARADDPLRYRALYADVLLVLSCVMLILAGSIAMFSRELISWLMPAQYARAAAPLAILCLAVVLQSTTQVTGIGISLERKTLLFARLAWITAGINLALNLLLIPELGALGAALAVAVSYLFLTGSYLYCSQALHPLPIRWYRAVIWLAMLIGAGAMAGLSTTDPGHSLSVWTRGGLLAACACISIVLATWRRSARGIA